MSGPGEGGAVENATANSPQSERFAKASERAVVLVHEGLDSETRSLSISPIGRFN